MDIFSNNPQLWPSPKESKRFMGGCAGVDVHAHADNAGVILHDGKRTSLYRDESDRRLYQDSYPAEVLDLADGYVGLFDL